LKDDLPDAGLLAVVPVVRLDIRRGAGHPARDAIGPGPDKLAVPETRVHEALPIVLEALLQQVTGQQEEIDAAQVARTEIEALPVDYGGLGVDHVDAIDQFGGRALLVR